MRLFTDHPASVGETYLQHMGRAFSFGLRMLGAGTACLFHGLLPFMFVRTGSKVVGRLHEEMVLHRDARPADGHEQNAHVHR